MMLDSKQDLNNFTPLAQFLWDRSYYYLYLEAPVNYETDNNRQIHILIGVPYSLNFKFSQAVLKLDS